MNDVAKRITWILINVAFAFGIALYIAHLVKEMCLGASAHNLTQIDAGTSPLACFIGMAVVIGGVLAAQISLLVTRGREHYTIVAMATTDRVAPAVDAALSSANPAP